VIFKIIIFIKIFRFKMLERQLKFYLVKSKKPQLVFMKTFYIYFFFEKFILYIFFYTKLAIKIFFFILKTLKKFSLFFSYFVHQIKRELMYYYPKNNYILKKKILFLKKIYRSNIFFFHFFKSLNFFFLYTILTGKKTNNFLTLKKNISKDKVIIFIEKMYNFLPKKNKPKFKIRFIKKKICVKFFIYSKLRNYYRNFFKKIYFDFFFLQYKTNSFHEFNFFLNTVFKKNFLNKLFEKIFEILLNFISKKIFVRFKIFFEENRQFFKKKIYSKKNFHSNQFFDKIKKRKRKNLFERLYFHKNILIKNKIYLKKVIKNCFFFF